MEGRVMSRYQLFIPFAIMIGVLIGGFWLVGDFESPRTPVVTSFAEPVIEPAKPAKPADNIDYAALSECVDEYINTPHDPSPFTEEMYKKMWYSICISRKSKR
jgi:hypothetical protein